MSLTIVVKGEEELGLQRLCPDCHQWWPLDADFWCFRTQDGWISRVCKVCFNVEVGQRRRAREAAAEADRRHRASLPRHLRDNLDARRAYWRDRQRDSRQRRRSGPDSAK